MSTAGDLNQNHIGIVVTLTGNDWSITGPLWQLRHYRDRTDVSMLHSPDPLSIRGMGWTDLTLGPWSATVQFDTAAQVDETSPAAS